MSVTRILLVDDDNLIRKGIRYLIEALPSTKVVAEAGDGLEALKILDSMEVDIIFTDISMNGSNGLELARQVKHREPAVRVIILSLHKGETYVHQALAAGVSGYLLKSADPAELAVAINSALNHQVYLTPAVSKHVIDSYITQKDAPEIYQLTSRQREVLQLIAEGKSTREISDLLCISVKTVETHRAQIMNRLDVSDVPSLIRFALRTGITSAEG
ncbi:MAG: response regulator transcription factor [Caldilineaceae bacterium]|nr:response regulator transcription factor [Caldilineaceae bacterium]